MLTKPNLKDEEIAKCLLDAYELNVAVITFLPLGADFNTAVYHVTTSTSMHYFLKLRRQEFNEASVLVPKYLADLGLKQIIPPLVTKTGQLWTNLASFKMTLYPYIEGHNAIERHLSDQQWNQFGAALKKLHAAHLPPTIINSVPRETFSPKWREKVKAFLNRIENESFKEPIAAEMASFLKSKNQEIQNLINLAENQANTLQKQPLDYILCHADIHGWNLLIGKQGRLYLVDWDTLIFAPKERDLMFIGAGIWDSGRTPIEEESLFYKGYGQTTTNHDAICYYRAERIIQDIGEYCEQIFLSDEGGQNRIQAFKYLKSNFLPSGPVERTYYADT
ncbi:MAG: phosphotransferase enzyme family protein [Pseudomonadota bacterium]|jgi:spectinomycin phosphotransferase|nr:aminoglycoside phosphotransferase family protein [Alphaproteobacteria bacterium]